MIISFAGEIFRGAWGRYSCGRSCCSLLPMGPFGKLTILSFLLVKCKVLSNVGDTRKSSFTRLLIIDGSKFEGRVPCSLIECLIT